MIKGSKMTLKSRRKMKLSRLGKSIHFDNLTNRRIGKWIVLKRLSPVGAKTVKFLCRCTCGIEKPVSADALRSKKHSKSCLSCAKTTHGLKNTTEYIMWHSAKHRAKKKNLVFSLKATDIHIPKNCPLLNIVIIKGHKGFLDNSPTLDRRNPKKGYTKRNSWVISWRANRLKSNASLKELQILIKNWKKYE